MDNWQEVVPNPVDSKTWDREGVVQGTYTQKREHVGQNDSTLYILKTKTEDISIWGSAVLDDRFAQIPIGSEVRVTGLGKTKSEKSGREYYDYKVEFRPAPFVEAGVKSSNVVSTEEPVDEVNIEDIPF